MSIGIICGIVICLIEVFATIYERKTTRITRVSTEPSSDHYLTKIEQYIRFGVLFGFLALAYGIVEFAENNWLILLSTFGIFIVLRAALAVLDRITARSDRVVRLQKVLRSPEFASSRFAFFFTAPDLKKPSHLYAWENVLNSIDEPWFAIVAEQHHIDELSNDKRVKAVFFDDLTVPPHMLPKALKVMLYSNNGQQNRRLIKVRNDLTHIQILHGDSDKPPSYSPLTKNYDLVFVAGQMAIDRYKMHGVDIPNERFRIVGRPQVSEFLDTEPRPQTTTIKLSYLPTWRGLFEDTQYSSVDRVDQIIDRVLLCRPDIDFSFKPHPMSYKDPDWNKFSNNAKRVIRDKSAAGLKAEICPLDVQPFNLYKQSDLIICDISSVMIDFLATGRPILVIIPKCMSESDRVNFPSLAACYEVQADLSNLEEQLELALGQDPLAKIREEIRSYAFGDLDLPSGEAFKSACIDAINQ